MTEITTNVYWIAHNNDDVVHYGHNVPPAVMQTGQPNVETFGNQVDWESRLVELGVDINEQI